MLAIVNGAYFQANVAFSRGAGWRGLCPAQTVTDRTVGYNAWLGVLLSFSDAQCLPVDVDTGQKKQHEEEA